VTTLRSTVIPAAQKGTDLKAYVGGTTAGYDDLASNISSKLPLQILVVILLSFLLLTLAFRTVVIPVQAALMNVLSIGAAYGVLTALFQWGWLHGAIGLQSAVSSWSGRTATDRRRSGASRRPARSSRGCR